MTNSEFKAWFDGFTEAMDGVPNKKQWDRVKDQVRKIDGSPITERHYVDRYWPSIYPRWGVTGPLYAYAANSCAGQAMMSNNLAASQGSNAIDGGGAAQSFNSHSAMYALGQLEAAGK